MARKEHAPAFVHAYLQQCYSEPEALVKYNVKNFKDSEDEARLYVELLCGRLMVQAKEKGVGVILLNMYESTQQSF